MVDVWHAVSYRAIADLITAWYVSRHDISCWFPTTTYRVLIGSYKWLPSQNTSQHSYAPCLFFSQPHHWRSRRLQLRSTWANKLWLISWIAQPRLLVSTNLEQYTIPLEQPFLIQGLTRDVSKRPRPATGWRSSPTTRSWCIWTFLGPMTLLLVCAVILIKLKNNNCL